MGALGGAPTQENGLSYAGGYMREWTELTRLEGQWVVRESVCWGGGRWCKLSTKFSFVVVMVSR